jgi:hypothetical protein
MSPIKKLVMLTEAIDSDIRLIVLKGSGAGRL